MDGCMDGRGWKYTGEEFADTSPPVYFLKKCAKTMLKCKSSQGLSYETNPVKTSQGFLTGGGGIAQIKPRNKT
jgi:hypothetical protein